MSKMEIRGNFLVIKLEFYLCHKVSLTAPIGNMFMGHDLYSMNAPELGMKPTTFQNPAHN